MKPPVTMKTHCTEPNKTSVKRKQEPSHFWTPGSTGQKRVPTMIKSYGGGKGGAEVVLVAIKGMVIFSREPLLDEDLQKGTIDRISAF
jgi:hypothetical protein